MLKHDVSLKGVWMSNLEGFLFIWLAQHWGGIFEHCLISSIFGVAAPSLGPLVGRKLIVEKSILGRSPH